MTLAGGCCVTTKLVAVEGDDTDRVGPVIGEPEVAVGARRDPVRATELAYGTGYSVMAWVVGLIIPIWPATASVNQRLPSGPAVIPCGVGIGGRDGELGDGVGRRVDHPDLIRR